MCILQIALLLGTPAVQAGSVTADDPRLRVIPYDVGQVVRLSVATGFQATVVFGGDERIENVAIGDSDGWQVTPNNRGDHLFVKPGRANSTTNMTVITDMRIYSFELSVMSGPTLDTPFTVRFLYPEATPRTPEAIPIAQEPGRYRLSGARSVRPDAINDDGVRTFIDWRPSQTLPAVFAMDDQGQEILLYGHIRDKRYVIDAVHQTLVFRLDRQTARASRLRAGDSGR